jgi:membrane protease YdiL (CAAX protease family)
LFFSGVSISANPTDIWIARIFYFPQQYPLIRGFVLELDLIKRPQGENMIMRQNLNKRIWLSVFLVLFLYVIVLYVPQILMGVLGINALAFELINLAIYSIFWFLVIPFGLKVPRKYGSLKGYLSDIKLNHTKPLGVIIFLGIGIGGLYLLILAVISYIFGSFAPDIWNIIPPESWVLLYGNIGAFFEEIAIRGVILTLLLNKYGKAKAVFLSAFIFGVGHIITFFLGNKLFFSLVQVVAAFCLGILFAELVIKTNSLIPGIIAHMIINSFSQVFQNASDAYEYAYLFLIASILTTMLGLVFLKYLPVQRVSSLHAQKAS